MSLLDGVLIVVLVAAALGGWQLGFVARSLAWAGTVAGLALGAYFVPGAVDRFGGSSPDARVAAALCFLLVVASVGHAVGLALGAFVHRLDGARPLPVADRVAGAVVGLLGVLTIVWMLSPSLASTPGWTARATRASAIVDLVDRLGPTQPDRLAAWGRWIAESPAVLDPLAAPPDPGRPPATGLSPELDRTVRASVVRVRGDACRRIQEGSGWVAAPGVVATNAHVVAGEESTLVDGPDGREHTATVVVFDPVRDLAVLEVPDLDAPPLATGTADVGTSGAVYGHPGGGDLRAAPARIGDEILAVGTDIYRGGESRRHVFVLAAMLAAGDSGGPLVDDTGTVVGVAFAIDPASETTAYALTMEEVDPVLGAAGTTPVDTGACVTG